MTNRLAPAKTTRYFGQTPDGRHYVRIVHANGERYRTPAYFTQEMAVADGACWEAFRVVAAAETAAEKCDRMIRDERAAIDMPVKDLRAGDFVWHTFEMKAAHDRNGRLVLPARTVSQWVEVSGSWVRDFERGVYGYRLFGFDFGYRAMEGETVKAHRDPKALKAAQRAATREVYRAFRK